VTALMGDHDMSAPVVEQKNFIVRVIVAGHEKGSRL
jgi:hypothetical protein